MNGWVHTFESRFSDCRSSRSFHDGSCAKYREEIEVIIGLTHITVTPWTLRGGTTS